MSRRHVTAIAGVFACIVGAGTIIATPAHADPPGTVVLASGPSGTPQRLQVLGASASYVLYSEDNDNFTVPVGGGSPVALSGVFDGFGVHLVGSLLTAVDFSGSEAIDFENGDGTGSGSVAVPSGYRTLTGSADGEYVTSTDNDGNIVVSDLTKTGTVNDLATLPNSADSFVDSSSADTSGLLIGYEDSACTDGTTDLVFVPAAGGSVTSLVHPASCTGDTVTGVRIGGGNAVWAHNTADSTTILTSSTGGGGAHVVTAPDDVWFDDVTSGQVGFLGMADEFVTEPVAGGTVSTASYAVDHAGGLSTTGSSFVFARDDDPATAGIYTATSATATPVRIATDGLQGFAATAVALGPGQVAYSDNATSTKPVYTRSLTTAGGVLTAGTESLVASSSTGYGLSLSGVRLAYSDRTNAAGDALELKNLSSGDTTTLSSAVTSPPYDSVVEGLSHLSGRRVLYPVLVTSGRDYELYDDVTGSRTTVPSGSSTSEFPGGTRTYALWGNYLVSLNQDGTITRKDLVTGTTTTLYTIPTSSGDLVFGSVAAWGNTVAWSTCVFHQNAGCTPNNGYLTAQPGSPPAAPTTFAASDGGPLALSSGYLGYVDANSGSLVAHPLAGGADVTVSTTPCFGNDFTEPLALDGSTIAWLDCGGGSGITPKAAPLAHAANPPWFLGDPQAPSTYTPGAGTWDTEFVTSASVTTCSVVISQGNTAVDTLPCDTAGEPFGDAAAHWDGTDGAGHDVAPGTYTWTLVASNDDGPLLNTDGSGSAVAGTVTVIAPGAPGAPTAASATAGNSQATVSWTAPGDTGDSAISGYDVQYSTDGGNTWTSGSADFHTSTATTQTVSGLTNGTSYRFRVAAINDSGMGAYSDPSSAVTPSAPAPPPPPPPAHRLPGAPTGVTASGGNGQASVSWTAPADNGGSAITGYDVEYSSNGGGTWTSVSGSPHSSTATTFTVTGLTNGTAYEFRVAAINGVGTGAYSDPSPAVSPALDRTALTIGHDVTIPYGESVGLTTTLTDVTTGQPLGAAPVELLSRTGSAQPFTHVLSASTGSDGSVSMTFTPKVNTQYEWHYTGDAEHAGTVSGVEHVDVAQVVTVFVAKKHQHVRIYGTVTPAEKGRTVVLEQKVNGVWVTTHHRVTIKVQKLPDGRRVLSYLFNLHVPRHSVHTYRVVRGATAQNAAGVSAAVQVRTA